MATDESNKNGRKRSLTQAGIEEDNKNSKKQKLIETESDDDEDMIDPCIDDDNINNKSNNDNTFIDLCEQCISLIMKCLLPHERIKCFIICKQIKNILQDTENKTIWNDIRLSLKYSTNTNNISGCILPNLSDKKTEYDQFKLQFIYSQLSYCKKYKNCIEIEIDKQYKNIQHKMQNLWV
eukprot:455920_1